MQTADAVISRNKPPDGDKFPPLVLWLCFFAGVMYALAVLILFVYYPHQGALWPVIVGLLIAATIIASLPYKSHNQSIEFSIVFIIWFMFGGKENQNTFFVFLPVIAAMLISLSYKIVPKLSCVFAWLFTIIWLLSGCVIMRPEFGFVRYFLIASTAAMLLIYTLAVFAKTPPPAS